MPMGIPMKEVVIKGAFSSSVRVGEDLYDYYFLLNYNFVYLYLFIYIFIENSKLEIIDVVLDWDLVNLMSI